MRDPRDCAYPMNHLCANDCTPEICKKLEAVKTGKDYGVEAAFIELYNMLAHAVAEYEIAELDPPDGLADALERHHNTFVMAKLKSRL